LEKGRWRRVVGERKVENGSRRREVEKARPRRVVGEGKVEKGRWRVVGGEW